MRRLFFDTESDYFKHELAIGDVDWHRELMKPRKVRFDCGVVYDERDDCYREFDDTQPNEMVELLSTASALISHSGKRHDLLVLEKVCGADSVSPVWSIPHEDLFDTSNWQSLTSLAQRHVPESLAELQKAKEQRLLEADLRWPDRPHKHFIEYKLAKAHFDVECTYAVFKKLSG